jgi:hypothetical protein
MIKSLFTVFLVCLSCSVFAQAVEKKFSKQQLIGDLKMLVNTVEAVHPGPYHAISKENFYKLTDSIEKLLNDDMTTVEAWPLFARVIASYDEGHASLAYPPELKQLIRKDSVRLFPLLIREFDGENLICWYDLSGDSIAKTGDWIVSVNGYSARKLMDRLTVFFGGLRHWRNLQVFGDFPSLLLLNNIKAPFKIELISNGIKKQVELNGTFYSAYISNAAEIRRRNPPAVVQNTFYTFTRTAENTGYINFRSMKELPAFNKFLDSVFSDIKSKPVDGLIIDLRQNGGGNSNLGVSLLNYITRQPYRMGGGSSWKVSEEYKIFIREQAKVNDAYTAATFRNYFRQNSGEVITQAGGQTTKPGRNDLRYQGKICVLIGSNTFSSANMLANAIKDYKLATLIGEATGEAPNDYGELYWSQLPNTGLTFYTCTKKFIRSNGDADDPDPVLPDIEVKQNSKSLKDDVLEFAKEWVKKK